MALKRQNAEICDLAKEIGRNGEVRSEAGFCYRELSLWWKDANMCEKLKIDGTMDFHDYYDCIVNIAENTNDSSLCEKIDYDKKYSPNKGHCYARFNN